MERIPVQLARRGRYYLPADLKFLSLVRSEGKEIVRIRFCRDGGTELDLPVSAETLADLVQLLSPLHGSLPSELATELADLQSKGLSILEE